MYDKKSTYQSAFILLFSISLGTIFTNFAGQIESNKFDQLPDEIIEMILNKNVDLSISSQVSKKIYDISKFIFKQRWEDLKKQSNTRYIPNLLNSIELSYSVTPKHVHFMRLYQSLSKIAKQPISLVKPKGLNVTNTQELLALDKIQDESLIKIWPRLYNAIILKVPMAAGDIISISSSNAQEIRLWLNDPENLTIIQHVTNLNLASLDLACLPDELSLFTNLMWLYLFNNKLKEIDLSSFAQLLQLNLSNNKLESIDLSNLSQLQYLFISTNQLIKIDLSGLINLKKLDLLNNKLEKIDLSNLKKLKKLDLYNNKLKEIDLSGLTDLQEFNLSKNSLKSLNLSTLTKLIWSKLRIDENELTKESVILSDFVRQEFGDVRCTNQRITN